MRNANFFRLGRLKRLIVLSGLSLLSHSVVWSGEFDAHKDWRGLDRFERPCLIRRGYGPFDYTSPSILPKELPLVEGAHFTLEVERLSRGATADTPHLDIDYTLRAFPNHHRALNAMMRLQRRDAENVTIRDYSRRFRVPLMECYLERARDYAPKDAAVALLSAIFAHKLENFDVASAEYQRAIKLSPRYPEAHYNFALLQIDLGNLEGAKKSAQSAYDLGFPLQGARKRLAELGVKLEQ